MEMAADATATEEKSSRSYWGFVLWPVAIIVLYVLSVGPVRTAVADKLLPVETLVIYKPLMFVVKRTNLTSTLERYLNVWGTSVLSKDGQTVVLN